MKWKQTHDPGAGFKIQACRAILHLCLITTMKDKPRDDC